MSFVQRLRMANMFPIRSDIGNARIDTGGDDMHDVVNAGKDLFEYRRNMEPRGIQQVGNSVVGRGGMSQSPRQLQFGGVVGGDSNPGADILARSRNSAEQTYADNSQELLRGRVGNQVIEKTKSPDQQHFEDYFNQRLKEKTVDANLSQNERRIGNEERRLDQADERIGNTESASDRRLKVLEDNASNKRNIADTKQLEADTAKKNARQSITLRAQNALDELNRLLDEKTDTLTDRGKNAFGGINNMISGLPWSTNSYDASTTRKRLKDLLTLDLIGEMKAQSKTGATGFGQMNLRELGVLEGGASRLEGKLSDLDAPGALKDVRKHLRDILMDETPSEQDFEVLIDPNGIPRRIPRNQVEEALKRGARRQ